MFSKISRYRKLSDIVATDIKGQNLSGKSLRLLSKVSGTFLHTVEEGDRLDHLAFKYYKQPRKWWRICDANPPFMSPQALLGKDPIVTIQFPVTFNGNDMQPPWADLITFLSKQPGIENINIKEDVRLVQKEQKYQGKKVKVFAEQIDRFIIVVCNQMTISLKGLTDIMKAEGFEVGRPENIGRIGKEIIIPADIVT